RLHITDGDGTVHHGYSPDYAGGRPEFYPYDATLWEGVNGQNWLVADRDLRGSQFDIPALPYATVPGGRYGFAKVMLGSSAAPAPVGAGGGGASGTGNMHGDGGTPATSASGGDGGAGTGETGTDADVISGSVTSTHGGTGGTSSAAGTGGTGASPYGTSNGAP